MNRKLLKTENRKTPAHNERFCVIAAVTPQIMQCKLVSYYPAESSVEAATSQSRHHVSRQWRTVLRKMVRKKDLRFETLTVIEFETTKINQLLTKIMRYEKDFIYSNSHFASECGLLPKRCNR
jgi:hypothetical protein